VLHELLYENDVRTLALIKPTLTREILVIGEPLACRLYEIKLNEHHNELGKIPNEENHGIFWERNCLYGLGPNMLTTGFFRIQNGKLIPKILQNTLLENKKFKNTNLQTLTILRSEHISACVGVHFDIKEQKTGKLPVIRVQECENKNGYKMKRNLYPRTHKGPVMVLISFNECTTLLSFGLDYMMYKWRIKEENKNNRKTGLLEIYDQWYIHKEPVTTAKVPRGGRYLICGTFKGSVLIMNPNNKTILVSFQMKYEIPVNSLEVGFNDPDDSCIYAIGDVISSIEKFMLTESVYKKLWGGIVWPVEVNTSEYLRRNPKHAAIFKFRGGTKDPRIAHYREKIDKHAKVLRKFVTDRK
jgi:hypothetical protein